MAMDYVDVGLAFIKGEALQYMVDADLISYGLGNTLEAVESISAIIEETASGALMVQGMAEKLLSSAEKLDQTAHALNENMDGLKTEISAFKVTCN